MVNMTRFASPAAGAHSQHVKILPQYSHVTFYALAQGRWFYALLSCIEKPLIPEASHLLRGLARNCAALRASLVSPK